MIFFAVPLASHGAALCLAPDPPPSTAYPDLLSFNSLFHFCSLHRLLAALSSPLASSKQVSIPHQYRQETRQTLLISLLLLLRTASPSLPARRLRLRPLPPTWTLQPSTPYSPQHSTTPSSSPSSLHSSLSHSPPSDPPPSPQPTIPKRRQPRTRERRGTDLVPHCGGGEEVGGLVRNAVGGSGDARGPGEGGGGGEGGGLAPGVCCGRVSGFEGRRGGNGLDPAEV